MSGPYRLHSLHVKHLPESSALSLDTVTSKSELRHDELSSYLAPKIRRAADKTFKVPPKT